MKQTLPIVEKVLKAYVDKLFQIDVETDEEFYAAVKQAKTELLADIKEMRSQNPELFYLNYDKKLSASTAKEIVKKIAQNAKTHYALDVIPSTEFYIDEVQGEIIKTPAFIPSLEGYNELPLGNENNPKKEINQFLLSLLLFLPIKKIKYTFVDFGGSLLSDFFLKQINPIIYNNKLITDTYEFKAYLKRMKDKVVKNIQQYQDVREYNKKNKSIVEPYEVIVLFDNADKGDKEYLHDYETELNALKRNCAAGGVFIIDFRKIGPIKEEVETYDVILDKSNESHKLQLIRFMKEYMNTDLVEARHLVESTVPIIVGKSVSYKDAISIKKKIDEMGFKANIVSKNPQKRKTNQQETSIVYPTFIEDIPALQQACIDYINSEAAKEDETQILALDTRKLSTSPFSPLDDSISIPLGKSGNTDVLLKMEVGGIRAHTFIVGQSGSGKSVLLHNIISSAMLTYSPEDLELYLLDFKLGGVEFNRYKGEKHVRAMLVDNSDIQVTLEILRDLKERMALRGRKMREAGVNTIHEYNAQYPNERMKRILFIADECHEMFRVNENNRSASKEISDILTMVAKEGRSQGVHLLFATQTLVNTDIGNEILNNIGNRLMLKCATYDSEKLETKSSDITSKLNTGFVYYSEEKMTFQAFYADKKQVAEIMQTINDKTQSMASNEAFYFSGASIFHFEPSSAIESHARKCKKMPVAFAGKSIDIEQKDVAIPLNEDFSENILLLGLNDEFQSTRVSMNLLVSLLATCKARGADVDFKIIDCLSDDDKYASVLDELGEAGLVDVVQPKKRASLFKQLAEDILAETAKETILFILGQDRFRELKLDLELEEVNDKKDDLGLTQMIGSQYYSESSKKKVSITSFSKAMDVILDKGPEVGVHTIIQLEKASNCLFDDSMTHRALFQKFKHLILLKADENSTALWRLSNEIHLEDLSKDEERLRAYYYAEESDTYTLFTPYMPLEGKELKQFIKTL